MNLHEPDDLDDPVLATGTPEDVSFWSTVQWRGRLGFVLCVLTGVLVYFASRENARRPEDVPWLTGGAVVGLALLWLAARIGWAWVEWPSSNGFIRGLKAALRYWAYDAAAERQQRDGPESR